jgi:hypothetical protein
MGLGLKKIPEQFRELKTNSGLYYKPMTIVNDDSRVINKLEASLTDTGKNL